MSKSRCVQFARLIHQIERNFASYYYFISLALALLFESCLFKRRRFLEAIQIDNGLLI